MSNSSNRIAIADATSTHVALATSNSNSSGNSRVVDDVPPQAVTSNAVPVTMEIESRDVIRSILQFLKEQNLTEAMKVLQSESGITLNTIDNLESFKSDILNGRWDLVLKQTSSLSLPIEKLTVLYEQVVFELLEVGERDLAKHIVRTSVPLVSLKSTNTGRYLKLEELCKRTVFSESDAYEMGTTKELRRQEIAEMLVCEVTVVQPSRLLALFGQALKYQQSQDMLPLGVPFDLFRNARKLNKKDVEDKVPKRTMGDLQSVKGSKVETLSFSRDGLHMLAGSLDGIIASFDVETLRLNVNLEYQNNGQLMTLSDTSDCILCSATSKDGELLAVGTRNGQVHVYKLSSGVCVRSFPQAHPQGITSLCFYRDGTQILTTSFDQTARIHGLKSGKALKEFRGHSSYVNCGLYLKDSSSSVLTGSSDGTVKLWDLRTTECLQTFRPGLVPGSTVKREHPIHTIQLVPNTNDQLFICTNSGYAYITTISGQLVKVFTAGKASSADFTCGTISPQGKYAYCVGEDRMLYAFEVKSGQLDSSLQLSTASTGHIDSIVHHPHRNLIATISSTPMEGAMLWIP